MAAPGDPVVFTDASGVQHAAVLTEVNVEHPAWVTLQYLSFSIVGDNNVPVVEVTYAIAEKAATPTPEKWTPIAA
jgi:hypothetical protein